MKNIYFIQDEALKSLIKIGTKGFYPLFDDIWLKKLSEKKSFKLSKKEKSEARKIFKRLEKHKCLERKRTIVHSLQDEEKELLMKAFFKLVEGQILNDKPHLQ